MAPGSIGRLAIAVIVGGGLLAGCARHASYGPHGNNHPSHHNRAERVLPLPPPPPVHDPNHPQ